MKGLGLALALVLVSSVTNATPSRAHCPGAEWVGAHDFTTVVLGAKKKGALGVNGYYRLVVTQSESCALQVGLAKVGFGGKLFAAGKVQYGHFPAQSYAVPYRGVGRVKSALRVSAELASDGGSKLSLDFTFVGDTGFWRYSGASWDAAGMWGGLVSQHASVPELKFVVPPKLTCQSQQIEIRDTTGAVIGTPLAVAIACNDLVIAAGDLNRVVLLHGRGADWAFTSLGAVSSNGITATFDYCAQRQGTKSAERLVFDGAGPESAEPDAAARLACGAADSVLRPTNDPLDGLASALPDAVAMPPLCAKFLATVQACVASLPAETRDVTQVAYDQVVTSWSDVLRNGGPEAAATLEVGCRAAWDNAQEALGALCPNVPWQ